MQMSIKIEGAAKIERRLNALPRAVARKVVRQALRPAAKPILATARALAPVASGEGRKSIKIRVGRKRRGEYSLVVGTAAGWFKGDQYYMAFQEFGTSKTPAHPFVRPAFERHKGEAAGKIAEGLWAAIKAALRG